MPEARAWLFRAGADLDCAEKVLDLGDPSTFCQSIAKQQQAIEKAIKALFIAFREFRGSGFHVGWGHEVSDFVGLMLRLPRSPKNREIQAKLHRAFDGRTRAELREIELLIPAKPEASHLAIPNILSLPMETGPHPRRQAFSRSPRSSGFQASPIESLIFAHDRFRF